MGVWFFPPEAVMMCSTLSLIICATARFEVRFESRSETQAFTLMSSPSKSTEYLACSVRCECIFLTLASRSLFSRMKSTKTRVVLSST